MYLYYVLVTIQLYVVFPPLLYALRKLERWHVHIFIGSFLVELFFMYMTKFVLSHVHPASLPGFLSTLDANRGTFILTYEFWFIAGGIIACHYDKILEYMKNHARALWITFGAAVAVLYGHYFLDQLVLREGSSLSQTVFQPIMVPYSLIITAIIWFAGVKWSGRRQRPSWQPFSRFIKVASDTSFGIFLIQPFPLFVMEWAVTHMHVPSWVHYSLIPVSALFVYFSSMLIAYLFSKTPFLANCIGRKATWKKTKVTTSSVAG